MARWRGYLLTEVDGASLALFRVAFGAIMLWEVVRYFALGRVHRYYIEPKLFFSYLPFITPWSGSGMVYHFVLLGALAILIAAGLFYRVAAPLFCAAFTYVFLLDKTHYLNHLYLVCLVSLLLSFTPANRVFSLDRLRSRPAPPGTVPRWSLFILRAQIVLVYFYGGVAKLNADWLRGQPLGMWLADRTDLPLVGPLLGLPATALVLSYGALLIDLSAGFLLVFRRTFVMGAVICVLFNALNAVLFSIGIFPYFMIASLVLFPDPAWPRRVWQRLRKIEAPPAPEEPAEPSAAATSARWSGSGRRRATTHAGLVLLHGYLLVQVLLPLRHWLHPGDAAWNEDGHRFAWRMKLRDKDVAEVGIYVVDPATGARERVDLEAWLTERQIDDMGAHPDMILAFAHFVADRHLAQTGAVPIVTAEVSVSLNGGPYRYLIDPRADLAAASAGAWLHRVAVSRHAEGGPDAVQLEGRRAPGGILP
jgi:hypothetical protein